MTNRRHDQHCRSSDPGDGTHCPGQQVMLEDSHLDCEGAGGREVAIERPVRRACFPKLLRGQDGGHLACLPTSLPRCHAPRVLAVVAVRALPRGLPGESFRWVARRLSEGPQIMSLVSASANSIGSMIFPS
jgi:hypothetical protein